MTNTYNENESKVKICIPINIKKLQMKYSTDCGDKWPNKSYGKQEKDRRHNVAGGKASYRADIIDSQ